MHTVAKKAGLAGIELIEGVVLSAEEWTPENVSLLSPNLLISGEGD